MVAMAMAGAVHAAEAQEQTPSEPGDSNPELGLTAARVEAQEQAHELPATEALPAADAPDAQALPAAPDNDHQRVVGTFGVGFFGIERLPIFLPGFDTAQCASETCDGPTVAAPAVGVRYWLSERLGVQAAVGFHLASGTLSTDAGEQDSLSTFGIALHAGAPVALLSSGHFVFEVVPFVNLGFAQGTVTDPTSAANDQQLSGFLLEIGGTVGGEVHFGFVGLPSLALQANIGLGIRWENRGVVVGDSELDLSATRIATTAGQDPWDLFTGALSAIYYFR